ncbi:MAG: NAD(+) synthase [Atopobiaceae bacterium]|nr:NAD(+) synthase [Atopobiaceae bacterium]
MRDGFISVAAVAPHVRVADVTFNVASITKAVRHAVGDGARVVVLPELCLTGATCGDLFWQDVLLAAAEGGVADLAARTADLDALVLVGAPVRQGGRLYDCCVVLASGQPLGIVPRRAFAADGVAASSRHFSPGPVSPVLVDYAGALDVPFGCNQLFACDARQDLVVAVELGADATLPCPPSVAHVRAGATLVCNLSASPELIGAEERRRMVARDLSSRLACGYVLADAGWGESTTDYVFAGHGIVAELGEVLDEAAPFSPGPAASEVDVSHVVGERRRNALLGLAVSPDEADHLVSYFSIKPCTTELTRFVDPLPFVPADKVERAQRCERVFSIQAQALAQRMAHIHSRRAVVGVSGGLDSTLALLVCQRAFDLLGLPREGVLAITMPGFGTSSRTRGNAERLPDALGATLLEVDITDAVRQHFADIGQDEDDHNTTYENAQARERTQVLMDIANTEGGLVVGTGDLSELALGWTTYNGDHMSMYGVNASVPKMLVRHVVRHVAETCDDAELSSVLLDILDTPVSPELLPTQEDGTIAQRTEDLVGPYELHDFFLFNMVRNGFSPSKTYRLAQVAFDGDHGASPYDEETILKWLKVFCRKFFSQQFKRSCSPDGPAVGTVGFSPRGGLVMPSDAMGTIWEADLLSLEGDV